ncbi:MAG: hypothetical protein P8100_10420 [bacterium]|jgi:hypothetical protein
MQKLRLLISATIVILLCFSYTEAFSQYENTSGQRQEGQVKKRPKPQRPMRFFAGGMIGGGWSTYSSYVEVSPIFGVSITPAFQVGTRITYIWNSYLYQTGPYTDERVNLHHYGASLFARYIIFKGLFAQVEYEALSYDWYYKEREWISSLFLGGGYFQQIGGRGFASFAILFNVLDNNLYSNPIIRIGFGAGF